MKSTSSKLTQQTYDWAMFLGELESTDNKKLLNQVRQCPFTIVEQTDEKGFTLVHHAVLSCIAGKVQTLINLTKEFQHATDE